MGPETTKTDAVAVEAVTRPAGPPHPASGVPLGPALKPSDLGTLGHYRVVKQIGKGGMGVVFLGVDPKLRRRVALKVMLPKFLTRASARDRFLREARALAAVKNDHIVTIYQVDESLGVPYLALEYLQGATLEDYLRAGQPLSMAQLVHVARDVALGLTAAHEHGVIHRDIKPENIWLEAPEGRVKLIDFGLARMPEPDTGATSDGIVIGTPAYMSPEQARGQAIDARSDLFSLGGVIYRLVSGKPPFAGDTALAIVLSLTNDPHVPLIEKDPLVPAALSQLVDRMLAKNPEQRPASAREVAKELKRIEALLRHSEPSDAKPITATAIPIVVDNTWASLETEASSATPSNSSRFMPPPEKKPVWPWVAGSVALLVVTVGIAVALLNKPKPAASPGEPPRRASAAKPPAPKAAADPFVPLLNGKELAGWIPAKEKTTDRWTNADGVLRGHEDGGADELLLTEAEYAGFELRFEYRWPAPGGDSGVVLFLTESGIGGIEIQLCDDGSKNPFRYRHGAVLAHQQPFLVAAKPSGEWNRIRITNKNQKLTVEENDQVINTFDFSTFADRKAFRERHPGLFESRGRIALQCKSGSVEFRNLRIKE